MKKYLLYTLLIVLTVVPFFTFADTIPRSSDRDLMMQILKEREEKFSTYTESLDEKSGFFGTKTKRDLKNSQLVLVEIVRMDNRLINVLNRQLDYKKFEGISQNYKQAENDNKLQIVQQDLDNSNRKIGKLNEQLADASIQLRQKNRLLTACIIIFAAVFAFMWRRRNVGSA